MIFISYKAENDRELAETFKQRIQALGVNVWIAPDCVPAGRCYAEEIPYALKKCEKVLLLLTKDALKSIHIIKEIDLALRYKKEVLPIQMGEFDLTPEFEYLLSGTQIRRWNADTEAEIFSCLMNSARVYEIEIKRNPAQKVTLIRGDFQDNVDCAMERELLKLDSTVFVVGVDRTGILKISSTKGILCDLLKFIDEKFHCSIDQMQELVGQAKREQLGHFSCDQLMEFGDCILIKIPTGHSDRRCAYFQLLLVANSQKGYSYARTGNVDDVIGIDSREIILRVFNHCMTMGAKADTVFIGAMGTNGTKFPYDVITAEIMNAFLYSANSGESPRNLFYSVRETDMNNAGVSSQAIYDYVRNAVSLFRI